MGQFCPPGSGSGSGFRFSIRIHWPDWIRSNPDLDPKHWTGGEGALAIIVSYLNRHAVWRRLDLGWGRNSSRCGWLDTDQVLSLAPCVRNRSGVFPIHCFSVELWNSFAGWVWNNSTKSRHDKKIYFCKFFFKIVQFVDYIGTDFIRRELLKEIA